MAKKPDELITAVSFALPTAHESLRIFKVSQRKDLDISTVNSAFLFRMEKTSQAVIKEARIAYGGIGPVVRRFPEVETYLEGKSLTLEVVDHAAALIQQDILPLSDVRGTSAYRRVLVDGLFRRYCEELQGKGASLEA